MFNLSKVAPLVLGLVLAGGLGLSSLASATTQSATPRIPQLLAEGGADRLQELRERMAEGGSDRLIENRVAEGGADRLPELRDSVALFALRNALRSDMVVADNRAEFGSKYQRY